MVRVLALHYSQSGQLTRAARSMLAPLEAHPDVEVVWQEVRPREPFPFPWPVLRFFDTFPECVHLDPPAIEPMDFDPDAHFDLVILAYQVWFLAPSLPITGFLMSDAARVLHDTPVITLIGCRNMWLSAQERMKELLLAAGALHIDNVVLVDSGPVWASFVTTPLWLFTGRKDATRGLLPPAGISDADVAAAARFGRALVAALPRIEAGARDPLLTGLGAVEVRAGYISGEKIAQRSFHIWGRGLRALGPPGAALRRALLLFYIAFLVAMILTVFPLGILFRTILRPFLRSRLELEVRRLEAPSGSSLERVPEFR
jgi:hypothetical protein